MTRKLSLAYTMIILILPITTQYKSFIPGITLGELLLLLLMPFILSYLTKVELTYKEVFKNPFFWFVLYLIMGSLFSVTTQTSYSFFDIFSRSTRLIFYIFCATIVSRNLFSVNYFFKWYKPLVIFTTLFLFFQIIIYEINGSFLSGIIPWLNVANDLYDFERSKVLWSGFYRPSSIFLEPGYYATFVLPYFIYTLFKKGKRDYSMALFLTIGLISSTSGQAIILCGVIWLMWFIATSYNVFNQKIKLIQIITGLIFVAILPFILQSEKMQISLNRLWGQEGASSDTRIRHGFEMFKKIDPLHKTIGVGYGNVESYLVGNGILPTSYEIPNYMNSLAYVLVNLGIIGFIIFICIFIYMFKSSKGFQKILLIILFILSGVGTTFFSSSMIVYVSIIMAKNPKSINKNNLKPNSSIVRDLEIN